MTTLLRVNEWTAQLRQRLRRWQQARVVRWEDRYIDQYRRQIADALDGIKEARRRREQAQRRL